MIEALSWAVGDELEGHTLPPVDRMRLITYAGAAGDFTTRSTWLTRPPKRQASPASSRSQNRTPR